MLCHLEAIKVSIKIDLYNDPVYYGWLFRILFEERCFIIIILLNPYKIYLYPI